MMQEHLVDDFALLMSRPQAVIAVQVYLELIELKKYYSVEYTKFESIGKIIITGKKKKDAPMCAFIPITISEYLDFALLQTYIKAHSYPLTCLALVGTDSTTVYYQIEEGLVEPDGNLEKNHKLDKKLQLDRDLEKHRDIIENAALLGIKANIPAKASTSSDIMSDNSQKEWSHSMNILPGCLGVFMNP